MCEGLDLEWISDDKMEEIRNATKNDPDLEQLRCCMKQGWAKALKETPVPVQSYSNSEDEINDINGIVFKGAKIIIPKLMHQEILTKMHTGNMGIQK